MWTDEQREKHQERQLKRWSSKNAHEITDVTEQVVQDLFKEFPHLTRAQWFQTDHIFNDVCYDSGIDDLHVVPMDYLTAVWTWLAGYGHDRLRQAFGWETQIILRRIFDKTVDVSVLEYPHKDLMSNCGPFYTLEDQ